MHPSRRGSPARRSAEPRPRHRRHAGAPGLDERDRRAGQTASRAIKAIGLGVASPGRPGGTLRTNSSAADAADATGAGCRAIKDAAFSAQFRIATPVTAASSAAYAGPPGRPHTVVCRGSRRDGEAASDPVARDPRRRDVVAGAGPARPRSLRWGGVGGVGAADDADTDGQPTGRLCRVSRPRSRCLESTRGRRSGTSTRTGRRCVAM